MRNGNRFDVLKRRIYAACRDFVGNRNGNIAMMFALSLPLMLMVTLGGIDLHRVATIRGVLQDSLDSATLAAARSQYVTDAEITKVGMASLQANLGAYYPDIDIVSSGTTTFHLNQAGTVVADVDLRVRTMVANVVLPPYGKFFDDDLFIDAHSEVLRSSRHVEVSLVLDTTGSMAGTKITDLIAAANELVGVVVQPVQTPFYSKVAIVPYSMGVNVDAYADAARGAIPGPTPITSISSWYTGTAKKVTAATKASPVRLTSSAHGFANGDKVVLWSVEGMTQIANKVYTVANRQTNTFDLKDANGNNIDGRNYGSFSNDAMVAKCARTDCRSIVTANSHGRSNDDYVFIRDVEGLTDINDRSYQIKDVTSSTFSVLMATRSDKTYTSGTGNAFCTYSGCRYFTFQNPAGGIITQEISKCVTERTGGNAYTDVSPTSARLGRNYPSASNGCLKNVIQPLTSNTTTLKSAIDALVAQGSTAGHIGVGWGWYTLSPNFNSLWSSNTAGNYDAKKILKAVVIMTDGEYNTSYYDGVISQSSTSGSGDTAYHINKNAVNGHPFDQTTSLCAGMRQKGVIVYTVGFQVVNDQRARDLVANCATSADHVYLPDSGKELKDAFRDIGREITNLRIAY